MNRDFGAFELGDRIGKGAMAMVYLAVQKSLQRRVVLKILYPHLADDEKLVQRFEREARAAAKMKHENIVQVIDFGRQEEMPFIAMEYVEGLDLRRWLDTHGTPPVEVALLMLCDICRGLEHAHSQGIVHRDIKPANVMFTVEGTVKIMDFGLARTSTENTTQMTVAGSVLGTPAYMSPEQAMGEPSDARSDIFSTGVLAYELLGGQRPFTGDSYSVVMRSILTVEPPAVSTCNPLVPEEAVRLIQSMLQKDVSKRIATASQVRETLEDLIDQMNLRRGRALLAEYAHNPKEVADKLRQKRLSRHLDQGLYYENMGLSKIEDALAEFRRVLHLEPSHAVAREHVKKLEHERARPVEAPQHPEEETLPGTPPPATGKGASGRAEPQEQSSARKRLPQSGKVTGANAATRRTPSTGAGAPAIVATIRSWLKMFTRLPVVVRATIGLVVVLGVIAIAMFSRRGPGTTGTGQSTGIPGTESTGGPGTSQVIPPQPESAAKLDTLNSIQHARIAADSAKWDLVLAWADSARYDTLVKKKREKREVHELEARALAGQGDTVRAQAIYATLIKSDTNFRLTPRWLTPRDTAAYGAARRKVMAGLATTTTGGKQGGGPTKPSVATAKGFVLITANPASTVLIDGHAQSKEAVAALRVELDVGSHLVVLSNSNETRNYDMQVSAGATSLVTYDPAGNGAALDVKDSDPPGAYITLDGQRIGPAPFTLTGLPPGKHTLVGELNGMRTERPITLKPKKTTPAKLKLK